MKYDLAKLMFDALKKNRKIFKKADNEEESDLEKELSDIDRRISEEPEAYKFTIQEFLDTYFEPGDKLVFKKNADLRLFFEHLYDARALNELIDRNFFTVNNSDGNVNIQDGGRPVSFEFSNGGEAFERFGENEDDFVDKIFNLFNGLWHTPFADLFDIKSPFKHSHGHIINLKKTISKELVEDHDVVNKFINFRQKIVRSGFKEGWKADTIKLRRIPYIELPVVMKKLDRKSDDYVNFHFFDSLSKNSHNQVKIIISAKGPSYEHKCIITLSIVFYNFKTNSKTGPLPEIEVSMSENMELNKEIRSFNFFESANAYEDAINYLEDIFSKAHKSLIDIVTKSE